jgi:hypothetical protein
MIASWFPRLSSLALQTAPYAIPPSALSPDREQLEAMSLDLAAMRQSVEQLTAQDIDQLIHHRQNVSASFAARPCPGA